jgi:glycosyltransferase involved in cell wall biosynthesis
MKTTVIIPTLNAHEPWLLKAVASCAFADEIIITKRAGLTAAVNEAVAKASGDYIAILPDDDYFLPAVERALDIINKYIGLKSLMPQVIHFPCQHQDEEGEPYGLFDVSPAITAEENRKKNVVHGSSFISKDMFLSLGGYRGTICMDADLWNRALDAGASFVFYPEPCVVFRWNKHSQLQEQAFGCSRPYGGMNA